MRMTIHPCGLLRVLVLLALAIGGCVSQGGRIAGTDWTDHTYTVERNVIYTPVDWPAPLAADVYVPEGAGPWPGVLLAHGGGWEGRSRADMHRIAEQLARRGFVAVNVSYWFAPAYRFPAQLHDVQQAVRWMRTNAAHYRIDPARIGAFGYSAGGHLVALLGTINAHDELDRPHGGEESRLQAVVAGGAPTDLRKFKGGRLVPQFLGATQAQDPAIFAAASPVLHVTAEDPPVFIYHGSLDTLVDVSHARDFKQALDAAGVLAELDIVHGLGHVTTFLFNRSAVINGIDFLEQKLQPASHRHAAGSSASTSASH